MEPLKVGVITDWRRLKRAVLWENLLKEDLKDQIRVQVTLYPIADLIFNPSSWTLTKLGAISREQVIIVNWDAANGDPEFGAHLALFWLEHRRPELLLWVKEGNVLIIESQTVLGVPCQRAYDALVGKGELPTSGLEEPSNPFSFRTRYGEKCLKTRNFPTAHHFDNVPKTIKTQDYVSRELFPRSISGLLRRQIVDIRSNEILYNGWFRRTLPGARTFPWVSIVETADIFPLKRHSTLEVARIGHGAVFATTMRLSTTKQTRLVLAMLKCANGNTTHLPSPTSVIALARKSWRLILTISFGLITPYIATVFTSNPPNTRNAIIDYVEKIYYVPLGMLGFDVVIRGLTKLSKSVRYYIGF